MPKTIWPKCVNVIFWSSSRSKELLSFSRSNQSFRWEQRCPENKIRYSSISWRLWSSSCVCYSVSSRRRVLHLLHFVHLLPGESCVWCSLADGAFHHDNHEHADLPALAYDLANLPSLGLQDHVSVGTVGQSRRIFFCDSRAIRKSRISWSRMARWGEISKRDNRLVEQSKMESYGQIRQCSSSRSQKGKLILSCIRPEPFSLHFHGIYPLTRSRVKKFFQICFQVTILSFQLALMHDAEYDRLIAICCEQFCGYWNLFRLVRNYITIEKCYQLSSPMCYEPEIILSRISQASQ